MCGLLDSGSSEIASWSGRDQSSSVCFCKRFNIYYNNILKAASSRYLWRFVDESS